MKLVEHKQKNAKISVKRRQNLIDLITLNNYTLCRAAKKLNIKFSTARLIYKKYKQTGKFFNKNMKRIDKCSNEQVKMEFDQSDSQKQQLSQNQIRSQQIKKPEDTSVKIEPSFDWNYHHYNYYLPNHIYPFLRPFQH